MSSTLDESIVGERVGEGLCYRRADARLSTQTSYESRDLAFGINGRFLTQPVTGVQRYGREIIHAIDSIVAGKRHAIKLFVPREAPQSLDLQSIGIEPLGPGGGHAWEQCILPFRHRVPLLNLCNTAPSLGNNRVVCIHDANVFLAPESYSKGFRAFYKTLQPWISRRSMFVRRRGFQNRLSPEYPTPPHRNRSEWA
jgi:hypothetical protein